MIPTAERDRIRAEISRIEKIKPRTLDDFNLNEAYIKKLRELLENGF